MNLLSRYTDLIILHGYFTDIKLVILTLYYIHVQPQVQLIKDFSQYCMMLTVNTVSNHKSYFDMQNILSELLETIGYYPEGFP